MKLTKDQSSPNSSFSEYNTNPVQTSSNIPIQTSFSLDNIKAFNRNSPGKQQPYAFLSSNVDPYASINNKELTSPRNAISEHDENNLSVQNNKENYPSQSSSFAITPTKQQIEDSQHGKSKRKSTDSNSNSTSIATTTLTENYATPNDSISFYSTPLNHATNTSDPTHKQQLNSSADADADADASLSPIQRIQNMYSSSSSSSSLSTNTAVASVNNLLLPTKTSADKLDNQDIMNLINYDMLNFGSSNNSSNNRTDDDSQALVTASEGKATYLFFIYQDKIIGQKLPVRCLDLDSYLILNSFKNHSLYR